jgi:hypothetical protein
LLTNSIAGDWPAFDPAGLARQVLNLGIRLNRGSCGLVFFGGEPLLK